MNACMLWLALACGTVGCEDGTLLVLENSKAVVQRYTASEITHVALVLQDNGEHWVYEAAPSRVTRIRLPQYLAQLGELNQRRKKELSVWMLQPRKPYTAAQLAEMKHYLDAQVGRRYSIKNYVRQKQGDGIHCAELTAHALQQTGRVEFENGAAESPGSLVEKVRPWHHRPHAVTLPVPQAKQSWCAHAWTRWLDFRTWCAWSCYETWTFCR